MSAQEFTTLYSLFTDVVASKSLTKLKEYLNHMENLDKCLIRECCLKTICSISREKDYGPAVKEILESKLFEYPHSKCLQPLIPTLISNSAHSCASTQCLYQTVSYLAVRLRSNVTKLLDVLGGEGYSALHLAVMDGDFKATTHLLQLGSDCNNKSASGSTAISLAIAYGHECLVPLLLNRTDVNSQDSDCDTPLMFAAWNNSPKIVAALIHHGADVNMKNIYGSNSIWNAVYQSSAACVLLLLNSNATMDESCEGTDLFFNEDDCSHKITKLYPGHQRSLLWVAVDRLGFSEQSLKVLLILLEAGYDVTSEHWLKNGIAADHPNNFLNSPSLMGLLQFQYNNPQNLKDLCRNSIRRHHRLSTLPFHEWVRRLCLPSSLTEFLTLSYIHC